MTQHKQYLALITKQAASHIWGTMKIEVCRSYSIARVRPSTWDSQNTPIKRRVMWVSSIDKQGTSFGSSYAKMRITTSVDLVFLVINTMPQKIQSECKKAIVGRLRNRRAFIQPSAKCKARYLASNSANSSDEYSTEPSLRASHCCEGLCVFHDIVQNSYAKLFRDIPWNIPLTTRIFFAYTHAKRLMCIRRKYKLLVRYSKVYHSDALQNQYL